MPAVSAHSCALAVLLGLLAEAFVQMQDFVDFAHNAVHP
jgi:hypothetical protein